MKVYFGGCEFPKAINQLNQEPILIQTKIDTNAVRLFNALDYKIDMMNAAKKLERRDVDVQRNQI